MSPFLSEAQRRKFLQLEAEGKLAPGTVKRWTDLTGTKKLPERVHAPKAIKVSKVKVISGKKNR